MIDYSPNPFLKMMNPAKHAKRLNCPKCGHKLDRVHRSLRERTLNWLLPVYSYSCNNLKCGWTGRIVDKLVIKARLLRLLVCAIGFVAIYKVMEQIAAK